MSAPPPGRGHRPDLITAAWRVAARAAMAVSARPAIFAAAVLGAWVVVRAVLLLFSTGIVDPEGDLKFGHLTKDLIEGLIAPARLYRPYPREGGALPFSFFAVPFFAVLGPSYLALKAAAVGFMALAIVPWLDLARRAGGPAAGLVMALLLVLPFRFYLQMEASVANVPTHAGGIVFSGWAFWALYRGFGDRTLRPALAAFLAGLAAGLGTFWVLTSGPIALGVGISALLLGARLRHLVPMAAGALPGALLAWWFCLSRAVSSGDSLFQTMAALRAKTGFSLATVAQHLWVMVTGYFPRLAGFGLGLDDLSPGWTAVVRGTSVAYYLLFLAAALLVLVPWRGGRARGRRLLLRLLPAVPLYLAVYLAANPLVIAPERFTLYRYFIPVVPFGMLTIALAVAHLPRLLPRAGRPAVAAASAAIVLLGLCSAGTTIAAGRFPSPTRLLRGYHTAYALRIPLRPATFLRGLRRPGRMDYDFLAMGLGASDAAPPDPARAARRWRLPPSLRLSYWEGVGARMRVRLEAGEVNRAAVRRATLLGDRRHQLAFARGFAMGRFPVFDFPDQNSRLHVWMLATFGDLPRRRLWPVLRGMAQGIGRAMIPHPEQPTLPDLPGDLHADVLHGVAVSMGRAVLPWRAWPAGVPLPGLAAPVAAFAPRRFARVMEAERRRQEALYLRYAAVAPVR